MSSFVCRCGSRKKSPERAKKERKFALKVASMISFLLRREKSHAASAILDDHLRHSTCTKSI